MRNQKLLLLVLCLLALTFQTACGGGGGGGGTANSTYTVANGTITQTGALPEVASITVGNSPAYSGANGQSIAVGATTLTPTFNMNFNETINAGVAAKLTARVEVKSTNIAVAPQDVMFGELADAAGEKNWGDLFDFTPTAGQALPNPFTFSVKAGNTATIPSGVTVSVKITKMEGFTKAVGGAAITLPAGGIEIFVNMP